MVRVVLLDLDFEELESHYLYMTIEDALRILPNLDFRVGDERLFYEKAAPPIVDLQAGVIEIQLKCHGVTA